MSRKESSNTTLPVGTTFEEFNREQELRKSNQNLARQLALAKNKNAELLVAVEAAIKDAAASFVLPKVPKLKLAQSSGDEERAIVVVSDMQLGKVTPTYNSQVCAERMKLYAEKIATIAAIQRHDHPVKHARLYLLGDEVEGELIFPHQPYQLDASLFEQLMISGPQILTDFIQRLLTVFETIHVVGVIGNHGRLGEGRRSRYNPESNTDRMLYFYLRSLFKNESRLTWDIPYFKNERAWYAVDYPFGTDAYGILLFHGDQIRGGFGGFPHYGLAKKLWGWRAGAVPEPFDYAIFGHWHTAHRARINSIVAWGNGSTESTNTYAQEQLAASGEPEQLLLFASAKRITSEYWVQLND